MRIWVIEPVIVQYDVDVSTPEEAIRAYRKWENFGDDRVHISKDQDPAAIQGSEWDVQDIVAVDEDGNELARMTVRE